ncbi:hypothetical protein LOZ65_004083 [Ophidiomyces ophidiicola]|nr:hypothetical protein LOZ65_004083 [Ophidiomyces ophidiicola]
MSTLSSPRPSIASARTSTPNGSRRPSIDSLAVSTTSTPRDRAASPSLAQRRNRAALRDYYNLKPSRIDSSASSQSRGLVTPRFQDNPHSPQTTPITTGELDSADFEPSAYVSQLLSTSSLSTILRAENSLVSDIRTLDGERKALVYDNYSKLIAAVETIGKMRKSLEDEGSPMMMTKTLGPAVGFVTETAGALIREQEALEGYTKNREEKNGSNLEKQTVRWALDTPRRLRSLLEQDKNEDAKQDWDEVKGLLRKWNGVKGVNELKEECEAIMDGEG